MSETKYKRPKFLTEEMENNPFYNSELDPYQNPPAFHYNLKELGKYAKRTGKKVIDMTYEELQQFSTL